MIVKRPKLNWLESLYVPAVVTGLGITFKHLARTLTAIVFRTRLNRQRTLMDFSDRAMVTMQYPEERWPVPEGYRGAPTLVRDEDGREKCVSCQLCEFVCPPKAIKITPGEITDSRYANVEKAPREFVIDMARCIYCGFCEEVCPEEAIFLSKDYNIMADYSRGRLLHNKQKLYEMGGVVRRPVKKWADK
ncbi:MAG: NADH-quinone oxidoreductase subunit I [Verrucomicrobiales bacterium]|jgi:NADH-quinone oxidoreductase subunit I|nr:NADH-quinone oxidoreductase subunit I [Verrucomicrobiales bacterium]